MEMLRKMSRKKKKAAEAGVEEDIQEATAPPEAMVEMQPVPMPMPQQHQEEYKEPQIQKVVRRTHEQPIELQLEQQEKEQEAVALDTFRQRISSYRNSQARYRNPMAPGFDYANWKPYGKVRYRNQEHEFTRMAHNLAPYVACIVESACQGVEEQRWAAMTHMHPEEQAAMESIQASRVVSRAASRDRLAM